MSNSSDPYTPEEEKLKATRKCLHIFKENRVATLIITKSHLVARDIDLLSKMKVAVSISITTLDNEKAKIIEPKAPSPSKRIDALKKLKKAAIPCSIRLDPIIPSINDEEIESIVEKVAPYVSHVVASTIKPRNDSMKRLAKVMNVAKYEWHRHGNAFYLPKQIRFKLLERVENACKEYGLSFAACREGYKFKAGSCDGSHLIKMIP